MINKQKTTLKEYENSKGREWLLIQGQGRGCKEERKENYPAPQTSDPDSGQKLKPCWRRCGCGHWEKNSKRYWAESCQPGCQLSMASKQKTPTGGRVAI